MRVWVVVAVVGAVTIGFKGAGPVVLGGRPLPPRLSRVVALLAPALLAALIAVQTFGAERRLVVDARLAGVGAAAVALALRVPLLGAVVLASVVTALVRAFA